jgi:hypothetical protein
MRNSGGETGWGSIRRLWKVPRPPCKGHPGSWSIIGPRTLPFNYPRRGLTIAVYREAWRAVNSERRLPGEDSYLVDSASSHMLVSKIKPCMSKYKQLYGETANGSLNQLSFI